MKMANKKTVDSILHNIIIQIDALHKELESFLASIGSLKKGDTQKNAKRVQEKVNFLISLLTPRDRDAWLLSLSKNMELWIADRYDNAPPQEITNCLSIIFLALRQYIPDLKIKYSSADYADAFNFDQIYADFLENSRIPELFDKISSLLEKIATSKEVGTISVESLNNLQNIIATLRRNRKGSYVAVFSSIYILKKFIKKFFKNYAKKSKWIGTIYESLKETESELTTEMINFLKNVGEEYNSKLKSTFPSLPIDKNLFLARPKSKQLPRKSSNK